MSASRSRYGPAGYLSPEYMRPVETAQDARPINWPSSDKSPEPPPPDFWKKNEADAYRLPDTNTK